MFLKIINYLSFICFLLLFTFLFIVLLNFFFPSTFSDTKKFTSERVPAKGLPDLSALKYVFSSGHKTERDLDEEREQRMNKKNTKMMQIKEKEEELKKIEEEYVMALSTAIDKWVEHANDEGWLTSFV